MRHRTLRFLIFASVMFLLVFINLALSQYDAQRDKDKTENDNFMKESEADPGISKIETKSCYIIPPSYWPKITIFKSVSAIICYIALFFGFAAFFIGSYAGITLNKTKVQASILAAVIIGILSRSIFIRMQTYIFYLLTSKLLHLNDIIAGTIVDTIFYIGMLFYVSVISVYFYETFTISAKEIFTTK